MALEIRKVKKEGLELYLGGDRLSERLLQGNEIIPESERQVVSRVFTVANYLTRRNNLRVIDMCNNVYCVSIFSRREAGTR